MSLMLHPFRPFFVFLFFAVFLCGNHRLHAQKFVVYDNLEQLQNRINRAGDTTLVLNFWATWCKPCVEELPCFDELREYYGTQNVQIVLVSLDFKSQLEKKFIPFLNNHRLKSEVALMADQDMNTWIPMIHDEWDGAIPATLVLKGKKRRFSVGKFENLEELETFVRPFVTDSVGLFIGKKMTCSDLSGGKK
ncbi:MAG: TlpA disulfide reductase family protein [Saprospiraceae bacterium]|nr:TlpA disulfide reductase family protein [Saprospiraceae bacterium]